jgi:F0F1-type ATP synthase delta subunit
MRINPQLKDELKKFLIEKIRSEKNRVSVVSGYNLNEEEKRMLKNKLKDLDWETAKFSIDPSLIAGIIITVGSRVIDLSLKGELQNLQNTIYEID